MNPAMTLKKETHTTTRLELLGIGSSKDRLLKANLLQALQELRLDIPIHEVKNIDQLMKYDVTGIPALVVNGKVVFQKVVPKVEDLKIVLNILLKKDQPKNEIKKIVVPTDFSETADNALQFAIDLAKKLAAKVHVVHVHSPALNGPPAPRLIDEGGLEYKQSLLNALKAPHLGQEELTEDQEYIAETRLVKGFVAEEIQRISQDPKTDLLIMGTTGQGGLMEKLFGSISLEVARKAACPVILVPDKARFTGFQNIVYASNYHPAEETVLPKVFNFARPFKPVLHFAHINEQKQNKYFVQSNYLGQISSDENMAFKITTIESENVMKGLNRYAEEQKADLMIMATIQRNFLGKLFHKSITQRMIFNTSIPLLILHFEEQL
jgi:nucleotide-binding universal stress UspA family protein